MTDWLIAHHVEITARPSSHTPGALMKVRRFVTGSYITSLTLRFSHVACQHVTGIPHLWRSAPYRGFFFCAMFPCFDQMARIYKHPSQHAMHGLAFLAPVAVLSVGGVCEKERGRGEKRRVWKQRFKALMVSSKRLPRPKMKWIISERSCLKEYDSGFGPNTWR